MKAKRPSLLDDSMVGRKPAESPVSAPIPAARAPSDTLRTSVYFHRKVHDRLRDIAHQDRKSMGQIIHEALDLWLAERREPTTRELKGE